VPLTFGVFLALLAYAPTLLLALCVGSALLVSGRTRPVGKRVVGGALGTAPAFAAGVAVGALVVAFGVWGISVAGRPWATGGSIENPIVTFVAGGIFLLFLVLGAVTVITAVGVGWCVGWRVGSGMGVVDAVWGRSLLRRVCRRRRPVSGVMS
jgi:hypothetical protein